MVKNNIKVNKLIKDFAEELKKEIPVREIILFGSYAAGSQTRDSDIDIVVVSPYFAKNKYIVNMQYLFCKAAAVNSLLEPIPATPRELRFADRRTFLGQVKNKGRIYRFDRR